MVALIDMSGKTVGRWTIIRRATIAGKGAFWEAVCVCGTKRNVSGYDLRAGKSLSCGCLTLETNKSRIKHGRVHTPEYRSWYAAKQRCTNPRHIEYPRYGGRGIKFCKRWSDSFVNFLADMGEKPSPKHSIERLNPNGNYEPGNCTWATPREQARNRRKKSTDNYDGEGSPIGRGRTEEDAIEDLVTEIEDRRAM